MRRRQGTDIVMKRFRLIRLMKPTTSTSYYWYDRTGISITGLFGEIPDENFHLVITRRNGLNRERVKTDNYEIIGDYKTGDIIKHRGSYIKIQHLLIGDGNFRVIGEDLGSGLTRRYPLTMRAMKVYTLSEKIKKRLDEERKNFIEKKKNWAQELAEMHKARNSRSTTARVVNPLGRFTAVRKQK